ARMWPLEYFFICDLYDLRVMDVICRRNQMKGFTDFAFCYPDVRFEQMLLYMDKMVNKKVTYHIYNKYAGQLISPDK
ncbi:MAG: glycosyltransferase family 2 protein, partial [Tannerellaceae bacterium]|nr:glycosyltransferase family 2 protein [Tannerellaceae bacterium]